MCGRPLETTAGRHQDTHVPSRKGPTSRDPRTVSRCGPWPPSDWFPGLTWEGWFGFSSVGNGSAGLVSWSGQLVGSAGLVSWPQSSLQPSGTIWLFLVCLGLRSHPEHPASAPCWTRSVSLSGCVFDASGADIPAHTRLSGIEKEP